MSVPPAPKVSRAHTFPLIWTVPVIAIAIGGWMGFRNLYGRGPTVVIEFADGSGVDAGKTTLEYKGVSAGNVEAVELAPGLGRVLVTLRLKKSAGALAREGSRFWIVRPEIGFSGVRGLDTLVTGVRINVLPGTGAPSKRFTGLDKAPAPDVVDQGRSFIIQSGHLGSLTTGAPVFYREFKVGQVEASRLAEDATCVLIRIHVDAPYGDLVRVNSKFWNAGGFNFKVSLLGGAEVKDTSLESLVSGGLAFATPDGPLAPAAPADAQFALASEPGKDWQQWSPKIPIKPVDAVVGRRADEGILPKLIRP